jgi:P-type Cu2+ transporter
MARNLNMDVPITLGVVLALGMSVVETLGHAEHAYFDSAVMLLAFLLAGRFLDQNMRRRTRAVAGNLAALKAETAVKFVTPEEIREVPVTAIRAGDMVLWCGRASASPSTAWWSTAVRTSTRAW